MEEKDFNFVRPKKVEIFELKREYGYLNHLASKMLLAQGAKWVSILADPERQALQFELHDEPGIGRHKIHSTTGNPLHVRASLTRMGMEGGTYFYIGDNIFQHIDHLEA